MSSEASEGSEISNQNNLICILLQFPHSNIMHYDLMELQFQTSRKQIYVQTRAAKNKNKNKNADTAINKNGILSTAIEFL